MTPIARCRPRLRTAKPASAASGNGSNRSPNNAHARWPRHSPTRHPTRSSGRSNTHSETTPTDSPPMFIRPPSTATTKGVRGSQPGLPSLHRRRPLRRAPDPYHPDRQRTGRTHPRLLSLFVLRNRAQSGRRHVASGRPLQPRRATPGRPGRGSRAVPPGRTVARRVGRVTGVQRSVPRVHRGRGSSTLRRWAMPFVSWKVALNPFAVVHEGEVVAWPEN